MADRKLPLKRNPLISPIKDEARRKDLIAKRRLGQTELTVDSGQVGTTNATKPKNLGNFDYAHIRVPLPKDLKGSGIFHAARGKSTPEAYFLMRRSSDGFVSATGMFKVAFPFASEAEEKAEKAHLVKLPSTSKTETAGNIWVPPQSALDLADEYEIRDWILVLLDPAPITNDSKKSVKPPPIFHAKATSPKPTSPTSPKRAKTPTLGKTPSLAPPSSPKDTSPRKRSLRSASPEKMDRKIATPKPKLKRARTPAASASAEPEDAPATTTKRKASRKKEASVAPEDVKPSTEVAHGVLDTVTDEVKELFDGAKKALQEAVGGSVPPESPKAKSRSRSASAVPRSRKRKATELSEEPNTPGKEEKKTARKTSQPEPKRRRVAGIEERKAAVRRRAAVGIVVGLAAGAVAPYISNFLGF